MLLHTVDWTIPISFNQGYDIASSRDRLDTLTSNIMVFGHNKLCQLPIVNSLPVIIKVLWPLATTNCDSCRKQMITDVVTTIWPQIVR